MKRIKSLLLMFVFPFLIVGCGDDNPNDDGEVNPNAPYIISLDRDYYEANGFVVMKGENFGKWDKSSTSQCAIIYQGGQSVGNQITQWNDTIIRFSLSANITTGDLYVRIADGSKSNIIKITIGNEGGGDNIDGSYKMIEIKAGTFSMGDNSSNEASPVHSVTISSNYMISEHEVTLKEFADVMKINLPRASGVPVGAAGNNWPAHNVTFNQIIEFCNKMSVQKGLDACYTINGNTITCNWNANGYRLPTEAEWEYAARANSTTDFGTTDYGWCVDNATSSAPKETKTKLANTLGLYDMNGNVAEWCWDYYSFSYYEECKNQGTVTDPHGSTSYGGNRVARGGSINSSKSDIKAYSRRGDNDASYNFDLGFRVVRKK